MCRCGYLFLEHVDPHIQVLIDLHITQHNIEQNSRQPPFRFLYRVLLYVLYYLCLSDMCTLWCRSREERNSLCWASDLRYDHADASLDCSCTYKHTSETIQQDTHTGISHSLISPTQTGISHSSPP
jgi:hypothetical protein